MLLLTGQIGIGKTSLSRFIQKSLADRYAFVELGNPYQTAQEQVSFCCSQFGISLDGISSIHDCVAKLEEHFEELLEQGTKPVIVFDESHLLTKRHLGLIHILSNLRAQNGPLVQILLVGQLEILELLSQEGIEALNQRIGVRCRLRPLSLEETDKYISFKLQQEGQDGLILFPPETIARIWDKTGGVPRLINHLCAHLLDGLTFKDTKKVTPEMVEEVSRESVYSGLFKLETFAIDSTPQNTSRGALTFFLFFITVGLIGTGFYYRENLRSQFVEFWGVQKTTTSYRKPPHKPSPANRTEDNPSIMLSAPKTEITKWLPASAFKAGMPASNSTESDNATGVQASTGTPADIKKEDAAHNATEEVPKEQQNQAPEPFVGSMEKPEAVVIVDDSGQIVAKGNFDGQLEPGSYSVEERLHNPESAKKEISNDGQDNATASPLQPAEGQEDIRSAKDHPKLESLNVDAVAWSEDPEASLIVIKDKILRTGDQFDDITVYAIEPERVLLRYEGSLYEYSNKENLESH